MFAYFTLFSCKHPNYSEIPQIELKSFNKYYKADDLSSSESYVFELKLKDGDGDLGLNENDLPTQEAVQVMVGGDSISFDQSNPLLKFNCIEWDKFSKTKIIRNINYNNIFFEIDKKVNGKYIKLDNSCTSLYAYRFERLSPENYTGPIDVNFTYSAQLSLLSNDNDVADLVMVLKPTDIIRIRIRITDRKLNVSNEVITPDFKVGIN